MSITQFSPLYTFYLGTLMTIHSVYLPQIFLIDCLQDIPLRCLRGTSTQKTPNWVPHSFLPSATLMCFSICIPKLLSRHPSQRPENFSWLLSFPQCLHPIRHQIPLILHSKCPWLCLVPSILTVITVVQVPHLVLLPGILLPIHPPHYFQRELS